MCVCVCVCVFVCMCVGVCMFVCRVRRFSVESELIFRFFRWGFDASADGTELLEACKPFIHPSKSFRITSHITHSHKHTYTHKTHTHTHTHTHTQHFFLPFSIMTTHTHIHIHTQRPSCARCWSSWRRLWRTLRFATLSSSEQSGRPRRRSSPMSTLPSRSVCVCVVCVCVCVCVCVFVCLFVF